MKPPCFVLHQHGWHIAIKLGIQSSNIWMNKCHLGCSPIGEISLWDKTIRQGTLAAITRVKLLSGYWVVSQVSANYWNLQVPNLLMRYSNLSKLGGYQDDSPTDDHQVTGDMSYCTIPCYCSYAHIIPELSRWTMRSLALALCSCW